MERPRNLVRRHRAYMNIGYSLDEDALRKYFEHLCTAGHVLDVYIPRHTSGRNKGYGFLTFKCEEDLNTALQLEHIVDGKVVKISKAGPRPEYHSLEREQDGNLFSLQVGALPQLPDLAVPQQQQLQQQQPQQQQPQQQQLQQQTAAHGKGPRLYVGGIPDDIAEEQIKAHFMQWGNVVDIYFPGKKGQKRVNYCFVTFDFWQTAQRACNESERSINGRPVQSISMAEERSPLDSRERQTLRLPRQDAWGGQMPKLPHQNSWEGQTSRMPHQDYALGPSHGPAHGHWTQDLQSYSLLSAFQQAGGMALDALPQSALLNYPPAHWQNPY